MDRDFFLQANLAELMEQASILRDQGHGKIISYSRKVFIPLTQLCRDYCHYCTFAKAPKHLQAPYLSENEVLEIARKGALAGCTEALFTLGDKPEMRYEIAREELAKRGMTTTIELLAHMCKLVFKETNLLPHVNPGVLTKENIATLRKVSISQGIMLENVSPRLYQRGGCHFGSPDKQPKVRLDTIEEAGRQKVPFTSGILIGIGETREERIESLIVLKKLHEKYGHIQEIIVQNFRAKPFTRMAKSPEPDLNDLLWSISVARLIFGPEMNIQAPPNLSDQYERLINAGINDWGGVSPVTKDYVNPEAPWPHLKNLQENTEKMGKHLVQRLASYPKYALNAHTWHDPKIAPQVLKTIDASGFVRTDSWLAGTHLSIPKFDFDSSRLIPETALNRGCRSQMLESDNRSGVLTSNPKGVVSSPSIRLNGSMTDAYAPRESAVFRLIEMAEKEFTEEEIVTLFQARGKDFMNICKAADLLRQKYSKDLVRYVVNRNINYTNVCYFKCQFCAFSKGKHNMRGPAYNLSLSEIERRVKESWERGATEVCMQGGIHPDYNGETYLNLLHTVKAAVPEIHVHAFSPLEVSIGAKTLKLSLRDYLSRLKAAGLGSLPGTAAEILDDEVRENLCSDKINTEQWLEVMKTAHEVGLPTTSTIMFGHIDTPKHWARHLLRIRELQKKTKGFTEFVPLPFIHMEAPISLRGKARKGPTFSEVILMHAVSRLVLHPWIQNIQVSWVKLGEEGVKTILKTGANDLGGTLMNESISNAAGTEHGTEMRPEKMDALIQSLNRLPQQRTTLYKEAPILQKERSYGAKELLPIVLTPLKKCCS